MITLTKCLSTDISSGDLERLYNEAFTYISEERVRMGDVVLKNALLGDLSNFPMIKYEVDGYLVGIASYTDIIYNNKKYMFHRHPIYGQTQAGSRAWWYSEEFQQKNSEYVRAEGFVGVITTFNPNSPAGIAVGSHFGSFGKYYNIPSIVEPEDINITLNAAAVNKIKAYVIDLMV